MNTRELFRSALLTQDLPFFLRVSGQIYEDLDLPSLGSRIKVLLLADMDPGQSESGPVFRSRMVNQRQPI